VIHAKAGKGAGALDAIYARQSVEKADSLSIQGQIELCRRETAGDVRVYQDRGYSGKNTNRPDFQRMMADVEQGLIRKIVVYRLDRFSRSIADFGRLWETLCRHNVAFVSINETFDTSTPMGRAMLNIIIVFAQLERETTAERVRDNYYQRVRLGAWPGGPAPFGFSNGRIADASGASAPSLLPNGSAAVVKRIFRAYAEPGATLGSVARALNRDGVHAPKREVWDSAALSRLLHSPLYVMADEEVRLYYQAKGVQIHGSADAFDGLHACILTGKRDRGAGTYRDAGGQRLSPSNHMGLVPPALWLACQYKLDENRRLGGNGRGKHTWLSGLLKCAACGYSVKVNPDGGRYYLVCSGRSNLGVCRQSIQIDLRELEQNVAAELERLLSECPDAEDAPDDPCAAELGELDRRIGRLMDALAASSEVSMAYVNRAVERLEAQRRDLLNAQAERRAQPAARPGRPRFAALDFAQKKLAAAQFIREIRLADETAEVIWKV